jgi:benzoylformate decarboxylase
VAGDGVGHARAWDELARLAEALGAVVYTEGYSTLWNFPADHQLFCGPMPNTATAMRARFDAADLVLLCGVTSQAPVSRHDGDGPLVPWRARAIAVDDSPWEIGKNQPVEVGLVGDVKHNLSRLLDAVRMFDLNDAVVAARSQVAREQAAARRSSWAGDVEAAQASGEVSPTLVAAELRDLLPPDAIFVDETISNRPSFVNVLGFGDPLAYFAANGLSLGYSPAAAVGIQMALPDRQVVNVVGDGSLLYYPQALWNAASEQAPVLFVVLNNGSYRVLQLIIDRMGGPWNAAGQATPGLTIGQPSVDFVAMARSFGLEAERVKTPAELRSALERGLAATRPYLVDVLVDQGTGG